ncbi:MAG: oxygenase MpaB family protein [Pseudomonadota bacterium]|nr:oxygenase MpaB family protein [Pseudomonadota bacterium]MEE3321954.1 oxygenase MpaB family protein [Pseudomonadota bacterium]
MALPHLITRLDRESGIQQASQQCTHPDAGLLGPGSVSWQILRESITILAQGRILVLALAHSRLSQLLGNQHHAIQRLQHSQRYLMKVIFGNQEQAMMTLADPSQRRKTLFDVHDSDSLLYAISAWMDSCLAIYRTVIGPLTTALEERLFEETQLLARALGVPDHRLPGHWHAHRQWWQQQLDTRDSVHPQRRELGHSLIRQQGFPDRLPYGSFANIASFTVPEPLVDAFDLKPVNLDTHRHYQRQIRRLMELTRRLPEPLRYQPVYHEARQRLQGRARAGLATRLLNRWWSGEAELVSSGWSLPKGDRHPGMTL